MCAQKKRRQQRIKQYVIDRDGMICCYCETTLEINQITLEHINPNSKRGTFNSTNLTVSCSYCNNKRGNKPFFDYCKNFNWSKKKLDKYKRLYFNNLKIKVLNIAKEECLKDDHAIPVKLINDACRILKIKNVNFYGYEKTYQFEISFSELSDKRKIKYCFESLIKLIEAESE